MRDPVRDAGIGVDPAQLTLTRTGAGDETVDSGAQSQQSFLVENALQQKEAVPVEGLMFVSTDSFQFFASVCVGKVRGNVAHRAKKRPMRLPSPVVSSTISRMNEQSVAEQVVEKRTLVGEGVLWDPQDKVIYWIDILSHELYIYDPATGSSRTIPTCQAVGTVVKRAAGGLVLALHNGFAFLDLDTEKMTPVADPERDIPANRFNDGKCDPAGRFWAGTMEFGGAPDAGALYCLDTDHTVTEKLRPVTISNGIVWTADARTMYYICTAANTVRAFDYDIDTGAISNERVVVTNEGEGGFDGMAIDAEDKLWVAVFGGWGVRRYDPETGALLSEVRLPIAQVTACAFGGDNLDELYITSAAVGLDAAALTAQPLAGSLVKVDPGVVGVPACSYRG